MSLVGRGGIIKKLCCVDGYYNTLNNIILLHIIFLSYVRYFVFLITLLEESIANEKKLKDTSIIIIIILISNVRFELP
jgi:hypothetical protein